MSRKELQEKRVCVDGVGLTAVILESSLQVLSRPL